MCNILNTHQVFAFIYLFIYSFISSMTSKPIISFGLITDVQYADHDNTLNYRKDRTRYYRNSICLVKEAVVQWQDKANENNLKFIIQLGDLIDGKSANNREKILDLLLNELKSDFKETIPEFMLYHVWGNHEFYNFKRDELVKTELNSAKLLNNQISEHANYYKLDVTSDIKLICLDFYELSTIGYDEDSDIYKESMEFLRQNNHNTDPNYNEGLEGINRRFIRINGALNKKQLSWLEDQLQLLREQNKKVIICGHQPIHPNATLIPGCLAWNFQEILDIFDKFDGTILAYFSGHDHYGHYYYTSNNILHITFDAILETPPGANAFVTIKIFENKIKIESVGVIGNHEINF